MIRREGCLAGKSSSDGRSKGEIAFLDYAYKLAISWEKPLEAVAWYRPKYSVVPDLPEYWLPDEELRLVVGEAVERWRQAREYSEWPMIVPKRREQLGLIPRECTIGYSIPTSYGGAQFPVNLVGQHRVHLLGGSPKMQLATYTTCWTKPLIASCDSNYISKMAVDYLKYYTGWGWEALPRQENMHAVALRLSLRNLRISWARVASVPPVAFQTVPGFASRDVKNPLAYWYYLG